MGNKIGHARKLERPADDTSASGQRDALYLSLVDFLNSPTLSDQDVQEILETGPYRLLDPSIGDSRDDKDKVDPSRTDVPDHDTLTDETDSVDKDAGDNDVTSRTKTMRARAVMEEITEGADTTALHRYLPEAARVSSMWRLLNWFMSRFRRSDLR